MKRQPGCWQIYQNLNVIIKIWKKTIQTWKKFLHTEKDHIVVQRPETTDTENGSDSSESIPSAVVQRANINERMDRLLASVRAKLEDDNIEIEEHKIEMEEDNIPGDEDMCANYYTHIRR